jgi:aspartyl-tRNA(Asn)/glutamyl-tRNA(Gln) amidotransferase subunit A
MGEAIAVFRDLGWSVQDVRLPALRTFLDAKTPITLADLYSIHQENLRTRPQDFGHSLRWRIMPGALVRAEDYVHATRWRLQLTREVLATFKNVDLLVTAGAFGSAPALVPDEPPTHLNAIVPSLTTPFNLAGNPALVLCHGFAEDGLPLGLQIAARPFDEVTLLAAGHAFELATAYRSRRPILPKLRNKPVRVNFT